MESNRLDTVTQDLRYGIRQLLRNPMFTAVALITLALGIGANTAIFSVVDSILFRPLPFSDSDELVNVWTDVSERGGPSDEWLSYANFLDLEEADGLESLAAWGGWRGILTGEGETEQLPGAAVSHDMFSGVLGVAPALGRDFSPSEDTPDAERTVILSHGLWQRAFGGDAAVLGRTIRMNETPWEIIGVMPPRFRPPFAPDAQLWVTLRMDPEAEAGSRGGYYIRAIGRRAPGTGMAALDTELRLLGTRLEREYPTSNMDKTFDAVPLRDDLVGEARAGLLVLLAAVGFVLLMACVNVANLMLARFSTRREELAVRAALGAGRGRIVRQVLTEAVMLAVAGGLLGVVVALWGTELLVSLAPEGTPRIDEVKVDARVLAITALATLGAGAFFGLVPALRAGRTEAASTLREAGRGGMASRGSARARSTLVAGQMALALVLLVGAGLLLQSFRNLRTTELGFQPENVLVMQLPLPGERYEQDDARRAFYDALEARLGATPGVESVGLVSNLPLTGLDSDVGFTIEGEPLPAPGQGQGTWYRRVTPDYFSTMRIRIVAGRSFTPADDAEAAPVVIINETFAQQHFAGANPVGKRINFANPTDPTWREIVGVAADIRNFGVREESDVATYLPYAQMTAGYVSPVLRTSVPPASVIPAVRSAISELDPSLAPGQVTTMSDLVLRSIAPDRFVALLLSLFAGLALVLAVVGLYGVVSYGVARRLPEMGVRMALGAAGSDVASLVVRQSLTLVGMGLATGLIAAALLSRLLEGLLFGVAALDPLIFAGVTGLLLAAAVVAAALPALRASRVDPVRVLSAE